jgi:hypothetical protein
MFTMTRTIKLSLQAGAICVAILAGCQTPNQPALTGAATESCAAGQSLGHFQTFSDLLIANFDSKPDPDDLMSVAALGTMLKHPGFACVQYIAVAGAYGAQGGQFIPADRLFTLAFGDRWLNAHVDRTATIEKLARLAGEKLTADGDVWIMEAGQSDVSAAVIAKVQAHHPSLDTARKIHVVQHSQWNEGATTPTALAFVKANSDYIKIGDGNAVDNGTPGFNTHDPKSWPRALNDPKSGSLWAEAKRLAVQVNGNTGYDNPSIQAGGFDFSDAAEACWIFGYVSLRDTEAFFQTFTQP